MPPDPDPEDILREVEAEEARELEETRAKARGMLAVFGVTHPAGAAA